MEFDSYLQRFGAGSFSNFLPFIGVVEDNTDNLRIGRVRVRAFGVHPEDRTLVATEDLPWAIVAQPTTSASISGIGNSPNGLELGTWVLGYFADGPDAQYPIVTHSLPGIHRPNPPSVPGGVSSGYLTPDTYASGGTGPSPADQPYHNQIVENPKGVIKDSKGWDNPVSDYYQKGNSIATPTPIGPSNMQTIQGTEVDPALASAPNGTAFGPGATIAGGNAGMMLTLSNKDNWASLGLTTYDYNPCPSGYACKDGKGSLWFHYGTALAFEQLTKDFGKGKLVINSAYRTPAYNATLPGAAKNSQHLVGRAIDVSFQSIGNSRAEQIKFAQLAVKNGFVGFGLYPDAGNQFMHIDTGRGRVWKSAAEPWFKDALTAVGWYQDKKGLSDVKVNAGAAANSAAANTAASPSSNSKISNLTPGSSASKIAGLLKAKGYNDAQIAGALGNGQAESGLNPGAYNPNDNGSPSMGIWQFHGDRIAKLNSYAAANGLNPASAEAQVGYFDHEMKNGGPGSAAFNSATNVYDANKAMAHYEVYQGYNNPAGADFNNRLHLSNGFYSGTQYSSPASGPAKGFVDPTNSLPYTDYRGNPSTHVNARGFNSGIDQAGLLAKDGGRMTGIPAAGDIGTFGEPELAAAPQYPYNHTYVTKSGNMTEFDDTPGSERINIEHRSGSGVEMFSDGSTVVRSKGNAYVTDFGDAFTGVFGKYFLSSVNDMHIRSTADMTQQSDGSFKLLIGNDGHLTVSGDYVLSVGEDIKIRSGKRLVIEAEGIDLISSKDINIESVGDINLKAKGGINMQATKNVDVLAVEVHLDDIVRMAEGLAKGNAGADTADIGLPPARTIISKNNLKTTTNMTKVTTTDEAAGFYAGQNA
jgi:hypothetical protein